MLISAIAEFIEFLFGHGLVAGLGRLVLLGFYLLGLSSIYWGSPLGPILALNLAGIIVYLLGYWRLRLLLLQPDVALWERSSWTTRTEAWVATVIAVGAFCLLATALLYNTPLHGAWMIPLPTTVMALQKLMDRRRKRKQFNPASPSATSNRREPTPGTATVREEQMV